MQIDSITTYFTEAVAELRQVRWPTRAQAIRLSIIVIIFTAVVSVAFGGIDYLLSLVVKGLLSLTY
jgi:preprotein translocase SecE subunit